LKCGSKDSNPIFRNYIYEQMMLMLVRKYDTEKKGIKRRRCEENIWIN